MNPAVPLYPMGDQEYVSLTTFRRSGEGVSTAVWIARDGDALIVTTHANTGKVKRLRNDSRVELRPCGPLGRVRDDAPVASALAVVVEDSAEIARLTPVFIAKYGIQFRLLGRVERLFERRTGARVLLRITPTDAERALAERA